MIRKGFVLTCCWLAAAPPLPGAPDDATPLNLVAWPAVSPDGGTVVFEWLGDLWTASSEGGEARRITDDPALETTPLFTPDGKRVVFTSDRTGSQEIWSVPAEGGEMKRHSWHGEGNRLECLSPDGRRAIARGVRERSGHKATRLVEIDLTWDRRERRLFDATAHSANLSPDGERLLFCRGGEQLLRKGYEGSRASQVWMYRFGEGSFERLLADEPDARSPFWHPDGEGFYYVSSKNGGVYNIWSRRGDSEEPEQLTFFEDDAVILRDVSDDGSTLVFRNGADLFRLRPGKDEKPERLDFWTREDLPDHSTRVVRVTGTASADFTPGLDQVVFSSEGDLWWKKSRRAEPERLTGTEEVESDVSFSPDGKWLYFLRDDGLAANYFRARLEDGGLVDVQPVTEGAGSKTRLKVSPGGTRIAWVAGNGDVHTARADGKSPRRVMELWELPTIDWSPDGDWLVVAAKDRHANRDLWLVDPVAGRKPVNLTRHPDFEGSPNWSPDGRYIVFTAKRGQAKTAGLWLIDFGKDGVSGKWSDARLEAAGEKARQLPTRGIEPTRVVWAADSKSVLFQSRNASNERLYSVPVAGGSMEEIARYRGVPIRMTAEGALLWRIDRTPAVFKDGKLTRFPISMRVERERAPMLRVGFRRVWRTLGERFYDASMNGLDWPAMLEKYERQAVTARDSRQFDRVAGQLLGELNASHLTFVSRVWPVPSGKLKKEAPMAFPGMVFEDGKPSGPLVIRRVVAGSPVSKLKDAPKPGEVIVRIAGEKVDAGTPLHPFFSGAVNRALPVVLRDKRGRERTIELRCISYGRARRLDRLEKEAGARAAVEVKNGPDVAYLPFGRMKWEDFLELEREVYRASLEGRGMILDLRNNGGGRVADHLLAVFCHPEHSFTVPRGGPEGYPHDRRPRAAWSKPLVVLCDENTFSNAEIFCHAMKQTGRAPLVGIATAGGVISAVSTNIPDVGRMQVPFRGWFNAETGADLDLNGAVPDHVVPLGPAEEAAGKDPQLARALEVLREEMEKQPQRPEPKFRNGSDR